MRNLVLVIMALCCALTYTTTRSIAGEGGLYPSAPPPGSAFVRFFNGDSPASAAAVNIRGKSYGSAAYGGLSPYAPVPQGDAKVAIGTKVADTQLKPGVYYTVLYYNGSVQVLEEPGNDNKLKAQIILINASSTPAIALKTADGSANIVNAVDSAKLGGRAVNPVKVPLSVYASAKKIDALDPQLLERGERYAVVVYDGPNGKPVATFN